ncbi:vWA domain-containing protein [Roseomonas genomospecies 6]|uniref:VWA domain-containing protein n=1 Tax=Roseomonas genomospecies 6 TaxID=214106 RepID=A0A9W7NEQ9_9PROT|nr:vWA domain-containing protein [Roseomonas genomospecies 6]KAA0675709.1 VWA domain-containing protein [Roseomonas genomospecies 6]
MLAKTLKATLLVGVFLGSMAGVVPLAHAAQPLAVEGVPGLDQRILTRPLAALSANPGASPASGGGALPTFTHFYVFERKVAGGGSWLRVGPNRNQAPTGWLPESATVPWRQAVALAFNQAPNRPPVLFFDQRPPLDALLADQRRGERVTRLVEGARSRSLPPNSGVLAIEPQPVADFRSSFYLLPILEAQDVQVPGLRRRGGTKLVKVASVSLPLPEEPDEVTQQQALAEFKTGVVFVIDTTISMGKYIDRTRTTVRRMMERIRQSSIGNKVSFGLVGFRDALDGRSGQDYLTRVFHPLNETFDASAFLKSIEEIEEAQVSNAGFIEDGLAGIQTALRMESWPKFGGRYVILISDAPVREANDPRSSTRISPSDMATDASSPDRATAIISILLKTPQGKEHHAQAESQFNQLSRFRPTDRRYSLFVPEGDLERFGTTIDQMADDIVQMSVNASQGQMASSAAPATPAAGAQASPVLDAGRAMQLAWLGNRQNSRAPTVLEGWAADFDPADPMARQAFDVNVLLTRNQLNELYQALEAISQASTRRLDATGGSQSFFAQLRHVLATAQTDPTALQSLDPNFASHVPDPDEVRSLKDLVSGFVNHLPYQSSLLSHGQETLEALSDAQLHELLTGIRSKQQIYKSYFQDVDRWVKLNPAAGIEEAVYPVPISLMP